MFNEVAKSARLISLPEIYYQLKELIDDPGYTMAEVALLVGRDPGLATRFLKVVNSPLNRRARNIDTVSQAVGLLGIRQVHDIVLSASVAEAFEGIKSEKINMKTFWERSFYCAVMTQNLALESNITETDRLFTIGLLHDIGHLFMYLSIPEKAEEANSRAKEIKKPLYQIERELLGFDYAKMGSHVLHEWNLPDIFKDVIRFHPEPGNAEQFAVETALLHLSNILVVSDLEKGTFGEDPHLIDSKVWEHIDMTKEKCLDIRNEASEQFFAVKNSIYF